MIRFDYKELRTEILRQFGTYKAFAEALDVSDRTLRRWLKGDRPYLPLLRIEQAAKLLNIPDIKIDKYFFQRAEP